MNSETFASVHLGLVIATIFAVLISALATAILTISVSTIASIYHFSKGNKLNGILYTANTIVFIIYIILFL